MQAVAGSDFHAVAGDSRTIVLEITESGGDFPWVGLFCGFAIARLVWAIVASLN